MYLYLTLIYFFNHTYACERKRLNFYQHFFEFCSTYQLSSIGWDNDLAPNRLQAIILTTMIYSHDTYMRNSAALC